MTVEFCTSNPGACHSQRTAARSGPRPFGGSEEPARSALSGEPRHRLRGHRHEPALRVARMLLRRARPLPQPGQRPWRPFAHSLVSHPDYFGQIPDPYPACGQPWGRRYPRAGYAGKRRRRPARKIPSPPRIVWGRPALRRWDDHPRDLCAERGGGFARRHATLRSVRRAGGDRDSGRAFPFSIKGDDRNRPRLWTGDDPLVPGDRRARDPSHRPRPGSPGRDQPAPGDSIFQPERRGWFRGPRRRFPGGHRR